MQPLDIAEPGLETICQDDCVTAVIVAAIALCALVAAVFFYRNRMKKSV
jgi:hypothetical protein